MLNKFSTKVLLFLLVAVMITALVACGGEKKPPVDDDEPAVTTKAPTTTKAPEDDEPVVTTTKKADDTTVPAPTTTAPVTTKKPVPVYTGKPIKPFYPIVGDVTEAPKPDVTEPAVTTTTAPAVTTTKPVTTTTAKPARPTGPVDDVNVSETPVADPYKNSPYTQAEYHELYVQDGLKLFLDFSNVNSSTPDIVGSADYNKTEVAAESRFKGASSNYKSFIFGGFKGEITGGTAKIVAPWWFEDYYKDGHLLGGGRTSSESDLSNKRTTAPTDTTNLIKEVKKGDSTIYVMRTYSDITTHYRTNGVWSSAMYASQWGNGYLNVGKGTGLYFNSASAGQIYKDLSSAGEFTIEYSLRLPETAGYVRCFTGNKFQLKVSGGALAIENEGTASYLVNDAGYNVTMTGTVAADINTVAFTYDMASKKSDGKVIAGILVNGKSYLDKELTYGYFNPSLGTQTFSGADQDIFAIRAYEKALSAEEVLQNHFADIALILKLDVTAFLELDEAGKLEVYKAFETKSANDGREAMQALLDEAVAQ